jgi:hypothetical protein
MNSEYKIRATGKIHQTAGVVIMTKVTMSSPRKPLPTSPRNMVAGGKFFVRKAKALRPTTDITKKVWRSSPVMNPNTLKSKELSTI